MGSREIDRDVDAAAELLYLSDDTGGDGMLRRVAESVRAVTAGTHAYILHRTHGSKDGLIMAVAGLGGPQAGERLTPPPAAPPRRILIPLSLDGAPLGSVVADGISKPLSPEAQRELALLAGLAARALQNHALVEEAERRATREAQRHFRLVGGTVYHLKNSLAQVSEYLELLEMEAELEAQQEHYVMRARRSLGTALRLLSELYELGRAEAGQVTPEREPLNLVAMIRDTARDYQLSTGTTGLQFNLELHDLPLLQTDPDCVRQILDNLISNAVRYSPASAPITIRAMVRAGRRDADPETWVRVDVVDRGPGVGEGDDVFEEIERVNRKGAPGFRLAISRRIARLLGGNITLNSSPDSGSTFTLWLPLE
jgi:signal transduction histidine kinase